MLDKNLALTDTLSQSSSLQHLADSYRSQLTALESKTSSLLLSNEKLHFDLDKTKERLSDQLEESRRKDDLLREWQESKLVLEEQITAEADDFAPKSSITALKLRIKQLERTLTAGENSSEVQVDRLVMERLIEDQRNSRERHETEFLKARREVLRLESILEDILSGKSKLGDGLVVDRSCCPTPSVNIVVVLTFLILSAESNTAMRQKVRGVEAELAKVENALIEADRGRKSLRKELKIAHQDRSSFNPFTHSCFD